jgi:aminoglycoside phosphotransferase (APT) family kinase protein
MRTDQVTAGDFSEASTRRTLAAVCHEVGLDVAGAELLRLGENALYVLPDSEVVVRIARSLAAVDDVRKEVRVARWLEETKFPAVRIAQVTSDQPLIVDSLPVTFWRLIHAEPPDPSPVDLGHLLRRLHRTESPSWLDLPTFTPFARVRSRLERPPAGADQRDVEFLAHLFAELQEEYAELSYVLPPGPLHGDAYVSNLMRDRDTGQVVMLDFESFSFGPPEWDLSVTAARYDGFAWMDRPAYEAFAEAYGFDVLTWEGFPVFRAIRELTMTTWLMQLTDDSRAAAEFRRRLDDLRSETFPRRWSAF